MQIVDLGNRNRWIRRLSALFLIAIVAMWGQASAFAISTAAAQCHESGAKAACAHHAAMPHHATTGNHSCCQKKPKAKRIAMTMPCCPVQQGPMPNSCGSSAAECCAVTTRDDSERRTAKPERSTRGEQPAQIASRSSVELQSPGRQKISELTEGTRYERPVFDLKTDLRI